MQQPTSASWLALRRELFSVRLDPLTNREIARGFLPVGAVVENPTRAIAEAEARNLEAVEVRVRTRGGAEWVGFERVGVAALRNALGL